MRRLTSFAVSTVMVMAGCSTVSEHVDSTSSSTGRPNVVIIFADDLGYADVGVYGAAGFATPHLDRMAAAGVRFTDFYVAQPVCSASRAALLTGCYPNRVGIGGALNPHSRHGLHEDEVTIAELCREQGYTTAIYGKWHLGHRPPFLPDRHGFDAYCITPYSNDMWPRHPDCVPMAEGLAKRKRGFPPLPVLEDGGVLIEDVTPADQAQFTTLFTERAVAFIEEADDQPFFLYLAHPMPHVPLFVSDKFAGHSEQGVFGDVIEEIDWSVGEILAALQRTGVDDETLVIFTSDNGPWLVHGNHAGSAYPLREGKGTTFDGGVREPCIMRWPGRIEPGSVCTEPAMTIDLLPTIASLIGAPLPDRKIDGLDITPLITGVPGATSPQEAYFFYYHGNSLEAVRSGRWKLHFPASLSKHDRRRSQGRRRAGHVHEPRDRAGPLRHGARSGRTA
jgi:arylsulfatase A